MRTLGNEGRLTGGKDDVADRVVCYPLFDSSDWCVWIFDGQLVAQRIFQDVLKAISKVACLMTAQLTVRIPNPLCRLTIIDRSDANVI